MFQMYNFDQAPRRMPEPDFNGAALIDDNGREIPITEDMILDACDALEQQWHYPLNGGRRSSQLRRVC